MNKFSKVYIIDNDPISNFVSEKIISFLDLSEKIISFLAGEDALAFLQSNTVSSDSTLPDLLLLDLDMPLMNGFQFIKALKKLNLTSPLEIAILSTSILPANVEQVKAKGVKFYVAKPLDVEKMKKLHLAITENSTSDFLFLS